MQSLVLNWITASRSRHAVAGLPGLRRRLIAALMESRIQYGLIGRSLLLAVTMLVGASIALPAISSPPDPGNPNLVPNPGFLGQSGATDGAVTGQPPTTWRGFAVGGGAISLETVPLPADELFPGSPPLNAIRLSVTSFGADQAFDHFTHAFSLDTGRFYQPTVWVRSGNADNSNQTVNIGMPLFDADMVYAGREPANFSVQAGASWEQVSSPTGATILPGEAFAFLAFRLSDNGGENSVLIALPEVPGRPVINLAPNPGLSGTGGVTDGNVTGPVPDRWRGFAIGDASLNLTANDLPADALFPGSPQTRSIRMTVIPSGTSDVGLDFDLNRALLTAGYRHWGEVWIRSGHAGNQDVSVALPLYDEQGVFLGIQPGTFGVTVTPQWELYAGPAFTGAAGQQVNLAFRLSDGGGENSIEIALPRIVGPADGVFADRFQ